MSVSVVYTCDRCARAVEIDLHGIRQLVALDAPDLDGWLRPPESRVLVLCPECRHLNHHDAALYSGAPEHEKEPDA